ncbi:MAG: hypothetical protein ABJC89_11765 [Acidobacteriota bacterium]
MSDVLGAFEQAVLLALIRLRDEAYGRAIRREVEVRLARDVAAGAVHDKRWRFAPRRGSRRDLGGIGLLHRSPVGGTHGLHSPRDRAATIEPWPPTAVATLVSGTTLTFASSDVDTTAIEALKNAQNAARTAPGHVVIIPTPDAAAPTIGTTCAAKWPANLSATSACRLQQKAAVLQRWSHDVLRTAARQAIRNAYRSDWPGDFTMESYCEEQQMRAGHPLIAARRSPRCAT